jgi:Aerotolerance regulator N-terminal/von Willebrand factor type A domain
MSFLTPLFLLGGLAVAAPIFFHLIRRTTRHRTVFSSLMFLMPSPPRLTRRSRLEHLLLLALRCGILCLLALGFARPFIKHAMPNPAGPGAKRTVILVDTSASMRRPNLWQDALFKAKAVLGRSSPEDQVALCTFDRQMNWLVSFDQWNQTPVGERTQLALGRLAAVHPGWSATHLGDALIGAAERLADSNTKHRPSPGRIVLITDLQEGSRLGALQGYEWPKNVTLSVERLKPLPASDASIQWVPEAGDSAFKSRTSVRLRIANAADSRREQFRVGWARASGSGLAGKPLGLYVPAGQSRIVLLPTPTAAPIPDRILLQGDEEDFNNRVFALAPERLKLTVLYFGTEAAKDPKQPLFFLERAFQETRREEVRVLPHLPNAPLSLAEVQAADLIVVTSPLPEDSADVLRQGIMSGKTVLFALRSASDARTLGQLLHLDSLPLEEAHPTSYAMLAQIDFRHPLFAPFADPPYNDFTKIHFWRYRRLDASAIPGARVLAEFDDGDPALLEGPIGKGRVLVLTSGWQPDDSQLALSSKFVPLMYSLLDESGAPSPPPPQYFVGDTLPLGRHGNDAIVVRTPDGAQISLGHETNFNALSPGVYTVSTGNASHYFVVNLDPAESRLAPMPVDDLEKLGAPVATQAPSVAREHARKVHLENAQLEAREKLWQWFIIATIAVLLIETWLGGRTARKMTPKETAPA